MPDPLISVIIPVYNVEAYIVKCIASVVSQTLKETIEIIVVDDCGQDNSIALAKEYAASIEQHNRGFVFLTHNQNMGQAAARNSGIRIAKGKFLYFIDSDDSIPADSLETLVHYAATGEYDIIEGQSIHIDASDKVIPKNHNNQFQTITDEALWQIGGTWAPVCWNKLINRAFFTQHHLFFAEGFFYEDLYWAVLVAIANPKILIIPDKTYYYLVRLGSTSNSMSERHVNSFIELTEHLAALYKDNRISCRFKDLYIANYERFRSIAIDYVYAFCANNVSKKLFGALSSLNLRSLNQLLFNKSLRSKTKVKVMPLYLGPFGHYLIVLRSNISKHLR